MRPGKPKGHRPTVASAPFLKRFPLIAEIFEREQEISKKALAARLHVSMETLQNTLRLMRRHPEWKAAYNRRAVWSSKPITYQSNGQPVTRRLRTDEFMAQQTMIEAALADGVPWDRLLQFPGITPKRLSGYAYKLRRRGRLPPETTLEGAAGRPKTVVRDQYRAMARLLVAAARRGDTLPDNRRFLSALNRQTHAVPGGKRKFPFKDRLRIRLFKEGLQRKVRRALTSIDRSDGRVDLGPPAAVAEYLGLAYQDVFLLAKALRIKNRHVH